MAAEYFDYNHAYNFRDRDVLLLGKTVKAIQANFEDYWNSELSVKVEELYDGWGLMQKNVSIDDKECRLIYHELHRYAQMPENFAPEVRSAITDVPTAFAILARRMTWCEVEFISDRPGKNENRISLGGGGQTTRRLAQLVQNAKKSIVIQSPYLVLSNDALAMFRQVINRGVTVRINTNSLASTDNLQAFSGYRHMRERLLAMGFKI